MIRVYSENGKRTISLIPYGSSSKRTTLPLFFKKGGVDNENKKRNNADDKTYFK